MDTSRPQHPIRTFRLVHVSSSLNDTAGTYDGKTDHRRMAAVDRLVARVREEDKTVNEGNHIPAHRATPHSFAGRDNYRCHPLANVMDHLPLPCTPLPTGNTRRQALQLRPKEGKSGSGYTDVNCDRKGPAAASAEEDRYDGS